MRIKIEKNIPVPKGGEKKSVLKAMEIGDSIQMDDECIGNWYSSAKNLGMKISVRRISINKVRIWRIK